MKNLFSGAVVAKKAVRGSFAGFHRTQNMSPGRSIKVRTLVSGAADALRTPPYVLPGHEKIKAPPMVYISGEEMTRYTMELILDSWIRPHLDIDEAWEFYDLSCKARDDSDDQVLRDAVEAGKRIGSIFKEPTITPSAAQMKEFGLSQALKSPNGAMRKGWKGNLTVILTLVLALI